MKVSSGGAMRAFFSLKWIVLFQRKGLRAPLLIHPRPVNDKKILL